MNPMFTENYDFTGKHEQMARALTSVFDTETGSKIFEFAIELYITAAIIGVYYNRQAEKDPGKQGYRVMAEQFQHHYNDCMFVFKLVQLNANSRAASTIDRTNNAFKYSEQNEEYEVNYHEFEKYVLGGLEILYEKLMNPASKRYSDYEESLKKFIEEFHDGHEEPVDNDEPLDFGPVFDSASKQ